jgi:hypothetical protein
MNLTNGFASSVFLVARFLAHPARALRGLPSIADERSAPSDQKGHRLKPVPLGKERRADRFALHLSREISPAAKASHWNESRKRVRESERFASTRSLLHEVDSGIRLNSSAMNKSGKNPNDR